MSLEQALHHRWAEAEELAALLPAERVKTGRSFNDPVPYATIALLASRPAFRTNAGDGLDQVAVRINVWHDDYDAGWAIVGKLKAAFDRSSFDLEGGARVVQMRRTGDSASPHDDGTWQFTVEFLVQLHLPSGI